MKPSTHASTNVSGTDMRVQLGPLILKNPVMNASGTFGSGREYADLVNLQAMGALVTKGVSLTQWEGNDGVRVVETASGMLNSIGLQNPGVETFCATDLVWLRKHAPEASIIVNIAGHHLDEYARVIERLDHENAIAAYEVNISCPNVDAGGLAFGVEPTSAAAVTKSCRRATKRPLIMKLSPNVTDITEIARTCEAEGADALSLINTLLGTSIDIDSQTFRFERKVAGLSGPAIMPIALRMVHAVACAVQTPIIGMGGIMDAEDAIAFMLAGASAVAIGTATFVEPATMIRCIEGIDVYCQGRGIERVSAIIGAVKGRERERGA